MNVKLKFIPIVKEKDWEWRFSLNRHPGRHRTYW